MRSDAGTVLFLFGLVLMTIMQGSLVLYSAFVQPRFPVDSYGYMAKAEQMRTCFRQDCPALMDLRRQVVPTGDPVVDWERNRAYHRGLYVYHPLHSAILAGLRALLPSWEAAWLVMTIAGEALLIIAIASFTAAVWSPMAAGIGLLAMAPTIYSGYHGLHTIVPGTLALAIALSAWALIVARTWSGRLLTPLFVAAMLTMHAVGVVFAGITLLFYLALMDRRSAVTWMILAAGGGLIVAYLGLPYLVDAPALAHWQHPPPADWTFWSAFRESLAETLTIMAEWSTPFGGPLAALLLVAIGLGCAPPWPVERRFATGAILAASAFASAFYVLPRYPAELFSRVWIPLAMFATTAIAWAWLTWLRAGGIVYAGLRSRASRAQWLERLRRDRGRPALGFLALGALTFTGLGYTGAMYAGFFPYLFKNVSAARLPLEPAQPVEVLQEVGDGAAILYMDEFPMYFYFTHGALDRPAVYYPAFREQRQAEIDLTRTGLVVAMTTGDQYKRALNDPDVPSISGGFPLADGGLVRVRAEDPRAWRQAMIKVDNEGGEGGLRVAFGPDTKEPRSWSLAVPADWQGWLALLPEGMEPGRELGRELRISRARETGPLVIRGIQTGDARTDLEWPWDQGVSVVYEYESTLEETDGAEDRMSAGPAGARSDAAGGRSEIVVEFDSQALIPDACESQGVVDDRGSMTAIRARCGRD